MPVKVAISLARGEVKINSRSLPVSPRHFPLYCLPMSGSGGAVWGNLGISGAHP